MKQRGKRTQLVPRPWGFSPGARERVKRRSAGHRGPRRVQVALCASAKGSKSPRSVSHGSWGQMWGAGLPTLWELEHLKQAVSAEAGARYVGRALPARTRARGGDHRADPRPQRGVGGQDARRPALHSLLRKTPLTPTAQVLSTVCLVPGVAQYQPMEATGNVRWPTAALSPQQSA